MHGFAEAATKPRVIDLDHNATTPVDPRVRAALHELIDRDGVGQPSSTHAGGQAARAVLEAARRAVAVSVGAGPLEVTFCSGGTEALNLAIDGLVAARRAAGRATAIAFSRIEHAASREPIEALSASGHPSFALRSDEQGRLELDAIDEVLQRARATGQPIGVLSLMLAHHELGNVYQVAALAERARSLEPGIATVCDAIAAYGKLPIAWRELGVDILVVSGHKVCAPAGAAALIHDSALELVPRIRGGGQERGRRSGTPGLLAIHGMGVAAANVVPDLLAAAAATRRRSDDLARRISEALGATRLGDPDGRLCNTMSLVFPGCDSETAVIALDLAGVRVSRGAACSSGAGNISPTWAALGLSPSAARSVLRMSLPLADHPDADADALRAATIIIDTLGRVCRSSSRAGQTPMEVLG